MQINAEQAMLGYASAYEKLYQRVPKDLHALDSTWIVVNGAQIEATELASLTQRLEQEYLWAQEHKRSVIGRLVKWLRH